MIEFKILEKTPNCALDKSHHYCDYIELVALCDGVDGLSNSDIYDRFYDDDRINDIGSEYGAESNEKWSAIIDNWFVELRARVIAYGQDYPFSFVDGRFYLKEGLSERQCLYLGLLLCSNMRYIAGNSVLSSTFEYLSKCAMKAYLPDISSVYTFGVSSKGECDYQGSLEDKIKKLAKDINYPVSSRKNVFRKADNGDGGVDIIAWVPFKNDNNLDKKLVFIGQSAATMDWANKQHSGERLSSFLNIENNTINTLYVPFDMRDVERDINDWTQVTTDILFDRHRLLNLLKPEIVFSNALGKNFRNAIQYSIDYEEDIV